MSHEISMYEQCVYKALSLSSNYVGGFSYLELFLLMYSLVETDNDQFPVLVSTD